MIKSIPWYKRNQAGWYTVAAAAATATTTATNAFEQHHSYAEGHCTIIDKRGIKSIPISRHGTRVV